MELKRTPDVGMPTGAPAFRIHFAQSRRAVALDGDWESNEALHLSMLEGLEGSSWVRHVTTEEQEPLIARVRLEEAVVDVL